MRVIFIFLVPRQTYTGSMFYTKPRAQRQMNFHFEIFLYILLENIWYCDNCYGCDLKKIIL